MPEPVALAITVACASLISGVVTLSKQITTFVSDVRASRKDMDAVSRELSSLTLCLEALRDDSSKISFPESLQQNLVGVLRNCDDVTKEMQGLLRKLSSECLRRRIQWSILDRDDMNKLRSRLEAHKSAIDIALDMISIFLITSVKKDTQAIKVDTTNIKQDTSQIASLVQEMGLLRLQISQLEDRGGGGGVLLDRFLAESTIYAESVADTEDFHAIEAKQNPTSTILEEGDQSGSEATRTSDDLDLEGQAAEIQPRQGIIRQSSPPPMQDLLPVAPSQLPVTDRDVDPSSFSDILPTGPPIVSPKVEQLSDRPHNKPKDPRTPWQPDHKAMKVASMARVKLSGGKQQQLDKKLLLLLEGKRGGTQNGRGALLRQRDSHSKFGTFPELRALLNSGADPNVRSTAGIPPSTRLELQGHNALIIELANAGRIEVVRLLLSRGADTNVRVDVHGTVLLYVVGEGLSNDRKLQLMEILLNYGAEVNAQGGTYGNALQGAAASGNLQAVELLLKYGAEVNAQGGYYGSALQAAVDKGSLQVVELLLKYRAEVNTQGGTYGNALQAAAASGKLQAVELLLKYGAEVNAQGGYCGSALQAAAGKGSFQVVELLLKYGAEVDVQGGSYGNALQAAAASGKLQAVELLLKYGAEVNAQGGFYGNALQAAADEGNLQVVELLLKYRAEVNAQGGGAYSIVLQGAVASGKLQAVELLLKYGAEVNAQGGYYGCALQVAADKGYLQAVKLLLKYGAEVNAQGGTYGNALQAAAASGNLQAVELLLKYGADVKARGGHYGSALRAALEGRAPTSFQRPWIVELLRKHGATED